MMNDKFYNLDKEKQMKIINSGLQQFGIHGFKNANCDDIASNAGISKGLLFHYFDNKKEFYLFLFHFCQKLMMKYIDIVEIKKIDDFFDLIDYGTDKKVELLKKYPFILNFTIKAFFSQKESVSKEMNEVIMKTIDSVFDVYFEHIDVNRFKDDMNPKQICQMLLWMGEGYLLEKVRLNQPLNVGEILKDFNDWKIMFKNMCYKEEYL